MSHIIQQNRVSLKNLKVANFVSEETLCFSAVVLLDGIPIADARNHGHGGCTFLHPLKGAHAHLLDAEVFANGLPAMVTEYDDPNDRSGKLTIDVTLDFLVGHIAQEMHANRKIRMAFNRDIASKVLFIREHRLLFLKGLKLRALPDRTRVYANLRAKHGPETIILNELPQEEAFALWKKHAVDGEQS